MFINTLQSIWNSNYKNEFLVERICNKHESLNKSIYIPLLFLFWISCSNDDPNYDPAIYTIDQGGVYMVGTSTDYIPNNYFRLDSARAYNVFPKDSTWFKNGLYDGIFYLKKGDFRFIKKGVSEFQNYSLGTQPISQKLNNSSHDILIGNLTSQESSDISINSEGWYYVLFHRCCAYYLIPLNSMSLVGEAFGSTLNGKNMTRVFSSQDSIQFELIDVFLLEDKSFNFQINGQKYIENSLDQALSGEAFSLEIGKEYKVGNDIILDNLGKHLITNEGKGSYSFKITFKKSIDKKIELISTKINNNVPSFDVGKANWTINKYSPNGVRLYSNDFMYLGYIVDSHKWVSIQSFEDVARFQYSLQDQIIGPNDLTHIGNDIEDIWRNDNYFTYNDPEYPYKFITISTRNYGENWDIQIDSLEWKIEGTVFGDTDSYHLFYGNNGWSLNFFRILQGEYRFIPNDEFDYSFGGVDTSYLFLNGPYLINIQENRVSGKLLPGDSLNHFRWNMRIL